MKNENIIDFNAYREQRILMESIKNATSEEFRIAIENLIKRLKDHNPM